MNFIRTILFPFLAVTIIFAVCNIPEAATADYTGGKLLPVTIDGTYFVKGNKRFYPVGAHWVPAKAGMYWPVEWNQADIEADFAKMHDLGFTLVRIDLVWGWFEPKPGIYNPEAFEQLDFLISMGHKYGIYIHPSMFIGGEVGEAYWDVPWRDGRHPHSDPEMLRLQKLHAQELGYRYANETGIIGWDLTDEPPFWIVTGSTTDEMSAEWANAVSSGLRAFDKNHPIVIGTSGEEVIHGPFRSDIIKNMVDFLSVHPFTIYRTDFFPDPMLSERGTYGASFEITLSSGVGKPAMIHEMGASSAQYSPERIAAYDRANMYSGLGAGGIGVDLWCFTDASPEQRTRLPYLKSPQENRWGLTTWDRQDKPRGREFRKFSKVVNQLDLTGLTPAKADAAIIVPYEWSKPFGDMSRSGLPYPGPAPYVSVEDANGRGDSSRFVKSALSTFIMARRAGMKADFPREYTNWQTRPVLLMPAPLTGTNMPTLEHVHATFFDVAKKYVEEGGTLYASLAADSGIIDMEYLFGARLADMSTADPVTLTFVKPFGEIKSGESFTFNVPENNPRFWGNTLENITGEIIAVDQDGNPAIIANKLGKGKTVLVAYPIENYIAATPSYFEKPVRIDLLYKEIRNMAGLKPLFTTDNPSVEATSLSGNRRGYAVLVNHSNQAALVTVKSSLPLKKLTRITPEGPVDVTPEGSGFKVDIAPYDGAIVEWRI